MDDDFPDFNRVIFRFQVDFLLDILPWKLCTNVDLEKVDHFKRQFHLPFPSIFRGYVSFLGGHFFSDKIHQLNLCVFQDGCPNKSQQSNNEVTDGK